MTYHSKDMRKNRFFRWLFSTPVLSDWVKFTDYHCIELKSKIDGVYQEPEFFLPNAQSLMKLLSVFGTKFPTAWDINSDGAVNTSDMLQLIGGYGRQPEPNPILLPLNMFELFGQFGEGNYWFEPLALILIGNDPISFIWYHTTPYDESDVFIEDDPNSFDLDVVTASGNIYTYTFVRK